MPEVSEEFAKCWQSAGVHLQRQGQGGVSWLKAELSPPFLEHLSFRLGNQLFFVRLEDDSGELVSPGSRAGLIAIAEGCRGHACLMPMRRDRESWRPAGVDWGLLNARDGRPVDPVSLVTDEQIDMTDWELQDFAVQVVRDHIKGAGRKLMSWQSNPSVDPSLWFVGDNGPEWVIVRAARYPDRETAPPSNWMQIAERCAGVGSTGHFASVAVANADAVDSPLWRGYPLYVSFDGLVRLRQ